MSHDSSEPAFPVPTSTRTHDNGRGEVVANVESSPGMSLRAYLAGQALAGFCSLPFSTWGGKTNGDVWDEIGKHAVGVADALVAELGKAAGGAG